MKIFIRAASCISPQKTFESNGFLNDIVEYQETCLHAIQPAYGKFIEPKLARRMGKIIKMGVATAMDCLQKGNVEMPGAIITGTAYGSLEDTITFLSRMIELDEEMLPPTAFIQSTHNTVAAQVALILKCHNYNNTFVHKGISFESALLDAMMLLKEKEATNILVGGIDEMTDVSFKILTRLGLYKRNPIPNLKLYEEESKGTIGGEGSVFFLLNDQTSAENLAEIVGLQTYFKPGNIEAMEVNIQNFLLKHSLVSDEVDLLITGKNGDIENDSVYHNLKKTIFKNTLMANYKHLCGEYPTSVSFALWLATMILKNKKVPEIILNKSLDSVPKKILIYNHYYGVYHSLILVSSCSI
ncbi:MAG: beta-ketoacyl synthase chain length factor [Chitinophagaceae bacterium]